MPVQFILGVETNSWVVAMELDHMRSRSVRAKYILPMKNVKFSTKIRNTIQYVHNEKAVNLRGIRKEVYVE